MRIGKIASISFGSKITIFWSRILVFQIEKTLQIFWFSNLDDSKNFQCGKFRKLLIWEIQ